MACPLGPEDGRYLRRSPGGDPERVIVLKTLGARERHRPRLGGRKRAPAAEDSPEPLLVPTVRATLIRPEPFEQSDEAEHWLASMRGDEQGREAEVTVALADLNFVLRSQRAAAADPYAREVARWHANVVRVGYGSGEQVADGRFTAACEAPEPRERMRRAEALAPQERLAAFLSGAERPLVGEELVLRARLDLEAARPREAALQARVALEALIAELPAASAELTPHREAVGQAANAALFGDPPAESEAAVADAVRAMRQALGAARRSER